MKNQTALIIYSAQDIKKNEWFINHLIECLKQNHVSSRLITADELYNNIDSLISGVNFIINRSRDYHISRFFEEKGIRSFNSSEIIRITNDKDKTYQYLSDKNIPFLPYIILPIEYVIENDIDSVFKVAADFGYPFVLKPAEGHGGDHVCFINNEQDLNKEIKLIKTNFTSNLFIYKKIILQKPSKTLGKDLRVYVLNNKIYASILRSSSTDFRANFSLGGNTKIYTLSKVEEELVYKIIKLLPSDLCGIDFVFNENIPIINEIEDAVGTRMLYANTSLDIVNDYAEYIISQTKKP